jgi:hypothetical protein
MTYAEDLALCAGMRGGPRRRHSYKRFSACGTVRLFSFLRLGSGKREWFLTAKRARGGMWTGAPGLVARLRQAEG